MLITRKINYAGLRNIIADIADSEISLAPVKLESQQNANTRKYGHVNFDN